LYKGVFQLKNWANEAPKINNDEYLVKSDVVKEITARAIVCNTYHLKKNKKAKHVNFIKLKITISQKNKHTKIFFSSKDHYFLS